MLHAFVRSVTCSNIVPGIQRTLYTLVLMDGPLPFDTWILAGQSQISTVVLRIRCVHLMKPMEWHGDEYNWIESKASFGDEYIHRKNHRGQVSKYVELYGQGILVYWYGYLDTLKSRGYTIVDRKELGIE